MSVQHDKSGRRSIQVEVEVPGSAEEVWKAVATGPGISSWFLPNTTEEWVGGLINWDMGPELEMNVVATVTVWDPPHRVVNLEKDWRPGAPPMTSEWTVEPRPSGTCVVRVVHSVFADTDEWDEELEGIESNWPCCFGVLRSYMTHFRGQPASIIRVTSPGARLTGRRLECGMQCPRHCGHIRGRAFPCSRWRAAACRYPGIRPGGPAALCDSAVRRSGAGHWIRDRFSL